jgi:hypothetical protein
MHRRLTCPLLALALAACGQAFTVAPEDGGGVSIHDASVDTGAVRDGSAMDARTVHDAEAPRDAVSEEVSKSDAGSEPMDAGTPPVSDAAACARTCPSGFDCLLGKCTDRAATHFSALSDTPGNWSYGYFASFGDMFQLDLFHFTVSTTIDVWNNTMVNGIEPSIFHNSGLLAQTYKGITLGAGALGLYPGATTAVSVVRWTAPEAGMYEIDASFIGISTPVTMVTAGVNVKNIVTLGSSQPINKYGSGNSFTYSAPAQQLMVGDTVDFYVEPIIGSDEPSGGTELDARMTAE